jgi:hypothetical protein
MAIVASRGASWRICPSKGRAGDFFGGKATKATYDRWDILQIDD